MKRKSVKKGIAVALAATMTGGVLPAASVTAADTEPELLAEFDFDSQASDGVITGTNAAAKVNGNCQIKTKVGDNTALYLDGGQNYLEVTGEDGSSLLKGQDEVTISFDTKAERTGTNWLYYAAPDTRTQKYNSEQYLGVMQQNGKVKSERYKNSGSRPASPQAETGSDWSHVDVVVSENATSVYVNGEKKAEEASDISLQDIVGDDGVFYIGKANWGSGEYSKAWIDNFRVYDGVLSDEAIVKEYEESASELESSDIQEAYDALTLIDTDDVRGNLPLVKSGKHGAVIDWKSSNPKVITDSSEKADDKYDGGVVTRPEAGSDPVQVRLTASITIGTEVKTKEFTVTVQPKTANLDTDYDAGYLWTFFEASGGYEKIFLGYSKDGLTWEKLNKDENGKAQPILVNDASESDLGVRDPHIIRSKDGDKYWILGTDLHAEGGGSGGSGWNQLSASQNLVVWESTDLVNWSEPKLVYAGFDQAGCVWAPEAIYDDTTGDYLVYWSARDKSKAGTDENALRVYVCRTRDFNTFSEPKVWLSEDQDSGKEVNIIDTTIVQDKGQYYRFSTSDWNTVIDTSSTLSEDLFDVRVNANQSENGDWKRIVTRSASSSAGFDGREGFTVYQLPDGKWCAMGDNSGYKAFVTDDLSSGKFTATTANFKDGRFRHGTVMRLSKAEEKAILAAYGEDDTEGPVMDEKVLADFNFDDDSTGFTSENAKAEGTYTLKDSYNEAAGKALYLDGSSSNYLTVKGTDGKALLAGAKELTISYEAKPDRTGTNWVLYAAPGSSAPTYQSETYLGIMQKSGSTTLERYKNSGSRPTNPSASTGNDWARVDIVMTETDTKMYVNGKAVSKEDSSYALSDIVGKNGILQIGKANWGSGEYYKGWIDNLRIESRALSADEVKELASDFVSTLPAVSGASVGTAPDRETALNYRGTDDHTAITTQIDQEKKTITSYVRKGTDFTNIPFTLSMNVDADSLKLDGVDFVNGSSVDLSKDRTLTITRDGKDEEWTVKTPVISNNPVLPGQYADPDIDYFDGKFWIFPTTDGYPSWSGTVFHAFSSENMVDWTDEGVIMELANSNPGVNENGVQIAASPWAVKGSAWAPTIEKKGDKYYFYYCGKDSNGTSAIGVAWADNPAGPYTDLGTPLLTVSMCRNAGVSMGQAIDPSIFTDDDGTSYITFGNGSAAIAELNDDMTSIKEGSLKQITGLTDFRESVVITKANGKYHWTWTCDDANSPNYHVNYGVSDSLFNENGKAAVTFVKKNLLSKDEEKGILGSGHQSVVHVKDSEGKDRYFMSYHRFYTPLDIFQSGDGLGKHRETCVDEITFDENGYMQITPTLEGVSAVNTKSEKEEFAIVKNPESVEGVVGETAEFTVEATGKGLTYEWQYCNANSTKWRTSVMEGSDTATVTVPVANWRDGQKYRCVVTNGDGEQLISETAVVTVQKPIKVQPVSVEAVKGTTAEFTVETSWENVTYQWEYCNANSDKWRTSSMEGNDTATIKVPAGSWRNGQKYRCVITAADGRSVTSDAAVLTVTDK